MRETTCLGIEGFQSSKPTVEAGTIACFLSHKEHGDFCCYKKDEWFTKTWNLGPERQAKKVSDCFSTDTGTKMGLLSQSSLSQEGNPCQKVRRIQGLTHAEGRVDFCKPLRESIMQIRLSAVPPRSEWCSGLHATTVRHKIQQVISENYKFIIKHKTWIFPYLSDS